MCAMCYINRMTQKNSSNELCSCLEEWIPVYTRKRWWKFTQLLTLQPMWRLPCNATILEICAIFALHVLNTAVGAFPEFGRVIKKPKAGLNHFHKGHCQGFTLQKTLNIKQHKVKNKCPTRWNSLFTSGIELLNNGSPWLFFSFKSQCQ